MRHHPSCWNKVLAKLGFRRVPRRYKRQAALGGRLSRIESLEARQMMTVTVNTLADVVDSNDGYMSLREALLDPDPVVGFHASLSGGRIALSQGQLNVNKAITITGPSADKLTIDAGGLSRVFSVGAGVGATISGLTIAGGSVVGDGGGVLNAGDLTLQGVVVADNVATSLGGGVQNVDWAAGGAASLRIIDSTIDGNRAFGGSGVNAFVLNGGVLEIVGSTISNNVGLGIETSAYSEGGGLSIAGHATGTVTIANSTVSGNSALYSGGIRFHNNLAPATITNTTIVHNSGGGVDRLSTSSQVTFHNTIVAANFDNASVPRDFNGAVASASSYNLIGSGDGSGLTHNVNGNKVGATGTPINPLLTPLDFHGGRTKTHIPLPGSPAVDAGGPTSAATPAIDQRGYRRATARPEPNVTSNLDIGAAELSQELQIGLGVTADFNGDHRDDQLLFDPVTREINAALGAAVAGGFDVAAWGSLWSDASITTGTTPTAVPGDFNGDGRDDVLIKTTAAFHVGISDGASFSFHTFQTLPSAWQEIYAGDVDGDGDDELVAWNASSVGWQVADFTPHTGQFTLNPFWGSANLLHEAGARHFIADANGDGREDLIRRTSAGAWGVALSQPNQFVAQTAWSTTWFNEFYDATANALVADGPLKKIIATFADVYNNVELELYPGLMKGPEATRQTKAGNNWDQAALLEEQLQALGLGDVKIASGKVRASVGQISAWLGLKNGVSASAVLEIARSSLDDLAQLVDASTTIEFTHAWVQAYLPTATGFAWIDLDPSWKFKNRQAGIPLIPELDSSHTNLSTGVFDEFSYLALNPTADRRLPLEFFEDQVMAWLASSTAWQGSSLAEVPYDGPIKAKQFETLPSGLSDGMTLAPTPGVVQYNDFNTIAADPVLSSQLTHRVTISLRKNNETAAHWTHDLVVPSHSLDTIHVTFGSSSATGVMTDPNSIATAGPYYSRLVVNGSVVKWAAANESFAATDAVKIELLHHAPTRLTPALEVGDPGYVPPSDPNYAGPTGYDRKIKFTESPGDVIALGLEANQYSRDSLADLQAAILAAVAGDTTQAQLIQDVDLLSSYAIAKYWHDYQSQSDAIVGLMGAVGHQQWVGSGRISSKPSLLLDPTGGAGDVVIDYLAFGMAPVDFGIDLPNVNNVPVDVTTGGFHQEAWQLLGYNSSALEHTIVEEVTSADSVSTIKGLQQAYQKTLGLNSSGNLANDDFIRVFESRVNGSARTIYHVYNIRIGTDVQTIETAITNKSSFDSLLASHSNATGIDDQLWDLLTGASGKISIADGTVTAMATMHRTDVDNWTGAVYIVDVPNKSMLFAIQPDGGSATNGGYSGGVTKAPPPELKPGTFVNATYAGDPVHVANGNMFRDETDIVFPNIGVPLTFSRHYDSQSKDDVGMGVGWTYSFSDMLYLDEMGTTGTGDDEVVWVAASGARHRFKKLSDGTYVTPYELKGKLTRLATNEFVSGGYKYVYLDPSGMEYHFQEMDAATNSHPNNGFDGPHAHLGRLRRQQDSQGNGVQIDYILPTIGHAFTQIRDLHTADRRLVFSYGTVDRISSITKYDVGSSPQTWTYGYENVAGVVDSEKRLASVTTPAIAVANASYQESTMPTTTTYSYYNAAAGDPAYAKGLLKKITEADGSWHTYEYYRNGRAFRVKQGEAGLAENSPNVDVQTFNYNLVRNLTEFIDERGNLETYIHQKNGLLTKQIHADRSQTKSTWGAIGTSEELLMTSTTDERGAVENFTYYTASDFKKGQLKTSTARSYSPATALLTTYDYAQPDATNKPHLIVPSTVVVDSDNGAYVGQKLTTTRQYHPPGDAVGKLWKTTDALGNVVEYSYYLNSDSTVFRRGLLKSIKQPAIVDAAGNPVQYETLFNYDAAGNVTTTTTQTVATTPVVVAQETFAYDSLGNVVQRIVGANVVAERVVTESVYDALGRLRETGFADANAAIDPIDGFTSRFKYDKSGRVRETIDPLGRITRFEYDRQGNVVKQINPDGTELLHEYDAFGNCIAKTDALGRTTRFVYDGRNRLVQTIRPDGALESVRYDGAGNVVATIDALGSATTFKYDAVGRLLVTKLPDPISSVGVANPTTTNKYDKLGNLIETIDPEANVTQFKYDKLGRVVQTQTLKGVNGNRNVATLWVVTGTLQSLSTVDYDAVGNVIETASYDVAQYDAAATAALLADPRAQQTPASIAANKVQVVSLRYDALGRPLKTINADNTTTSTTYDAAGRVRFQYDELNRVTELQYDQFGRLVKTILPDSDGAGTEYASPTTTYRYDAAGNRVAASDPRGFTTRFEYDVFNRVAATVDAQGNRTESLYDVAGQMVAVVDALGRAAYTRYDKRGRAIEQRQADPDGAGAGVAPVTRHRYDAAGRVIETNDPLGSSTLYEYDRLGRVIKETFATAYQVLDAGDSGFHIQSGIPGDADQSSDYGGDSLLVAPPAGGGNTVMYWRFDNLEPGAYRILAHWSGQPTATTSLLYRVSDYYNAATGVSGAFFNLDSNDIDTTFAGSQRVPAGELRRLENGVWTDWKELSSSFLVGPDGPGSLGVQFIAANQAVHADAIRIERIASRSYAYDANGNRIAELDPLGRVTTFAYDELDRIVTETLPDPDGAAALPSPQTTTSYDGYGNVAKTVERNSPTTTADDAITEYQYNSRNRRTRDTFDPNGAAQTIIDFRYDAVGNLIEKLELPRDAAYQVLDAGDSGFHIQSGIPGDADQSSDYGGDSLLVAPPAGGGNTVMYWRFDNLEPGAYRILAHWSGQPTATTSLLYRVSDYYDAVAETSGAFFNLDSNDIDTTFAGSQRVPAGELRRLENGVWTDWKELSSSFLVGPDGPGSLGVQFIGINQAVHADAIRIERIERRTSYKYDALNRLVEQVDNANGVGADRDATVTHYDAAGNVVKVEENPGVDPRQIVALYRYDALGQLIEQTDQGLVNSQTERRTTRFQYDAVGNQTAAIDPLHRLSRSEYDRLDRLVKSIDPDPDGSGPLLPHATTFAYDAAGNLLSQTNGANETEEFAYDLQGRLVRSEDGRGDVTTRRYDLAGNLTKLVDPAGNATTYAYDGLDRQLTETTSAGTRQFVYDVNGNLVYAVDRNGRASLFGYDRLDRLASERWYASLSDAQSTPSAWSQLFVKSYDDLGRLVRDQSIQKEVAGGPIVYRATDSYRYDGLDRVVEHSNQDLLVPAGPHSTGPAVTQTYAYAYDSSGLIETREQFIAGQFAASTKSTYNAFDELVRQEDQEVNAASVASTILDFESTDAVFSYLGDGSLASTTRYTDWDAALPGGAGHRNRVQTTYAYDGAGRLKSIAHGQSRRTTATWPGNTPLAEFTYGYDAAGRINFQGTDWNTFTTGLWSRTDETQTFAYDAAGQLLSADSNLANRDSTYAYGANGNRSSVTEPGAGTAVFAPPGANNRVSRDSTYRYEYDAEGNVTLRWSQVSDGAGGFVDAGHWTSYVWDHRNRLVSATDWNEHDLTEVAYRYNASDDLVYRSVIENGEAAQVEHYLVESGQRTMAFEQDGDVKRRYQYGPTGEVLFDQVFDATVTTPSQSEVDLLLLMGDHQHSTRIVLDHASSDAAYIRQSIDYAQFGRVTATLAANGAIDSTGVVTAFGHHGSITDTVTGLQIKGERWYSPDLGRFISEDPIQDGANWYMFAGNNPVNYADPSGLSQQGHPLAGGYSGNVTRQPTIKPGYIPANSLGGFVGAGLGTSILSGGLGGGTRLPSVGSIASYQAAAPRATGNVGRANASRVSPAPSTAPQSPPTGFFQGVVNKATPYLPWGQAPLASTFGKFALDLNARNADGIVEGARATGTHVSDVFASNSIGEAAQKHVAFSLGNASQSMFAHHPQVQHFAQYAGPLAHWTNTESATRGETAVPFTDFVATSAISGGGGQLISNVGRLRVGLNTQALKSLTQVNQGVPLNVVKVSLAPKKVNLNSNIAVSNYGVYDIVVDDALYKVGKADLNRVTQSSGLPTRIHQQVRKLREVYGNKVAVGPIKNLGATTTSQAKIAETVRLQSHYDQTGVIPVGNQKSFRPNSY